MRVLHLLSQRPSLTGSGITLDAMVRHAGAAGWEQRVAVGVPAGESQPDVGGLRADFVHPLVFGSDELPFPVPGMSDVMPYQSTVFSTMANAQIEIYLTAWRRHISTILSSFKAHVIHSHHIWLMSALLRDLAPHLPIVSQCHATGLRQMELVPRLASRVVRGCAEHDAFTVLHRLHARDLARTLRVPHDRIHRVGAGYREDLFHTRGRRTEGPPSLLFIGKYSRAKGLPSLLDAFAALSPIRPDLELHIAGDGSGPEAEALRQRMRSMAPRVVLHGQLGQPELANLMRRSTVVVLPSFYEGLPLVLVEALACGCRLVATNLPGVVDELAPRLGDALELVAAPPMAGIDTPVGHELPAFAERLTHGLRRALDSPPLGDRREALESFTWKAVFARFERVWMRVIDASR